MAESGHIVRTLQIPNWWVHLSSGCRPWLTGVDEKSMCPIRVGHLSSTAFSEHDAPCLKGEWQDIQPREGRSLRRRWPPDRQPRWPWDPRLGTRWGRKGRESDRCSHFVGERAGVLVRSGFMSVCGTAWEASRILGPWIESSRVTRAGASFSHPEAYIPCRHLECSQKKLGSSYVQRKEVERSKNGQRRRKPLTYQIEIISANITVFNNQSGWFAGSSQFSGPFRPSLE